MDADAIVAELGMRPHPEGGHYVETFRGPPDGTGRATCTAIYFLLRAGERSHWHRVDADEVWLHHAGDSLALSVVTDSGERHAHRLGSNLADGQRPHAVVPAGAWQAAEPLGAYAFVSCVVAPGFDFAGFELAPPGWEPEVGSG
jgi:predicted cupin superfamily sugar epimerase